MFCFTAVDFGFTFKLLSRLEKRNTSPIKTPPQTQTNKQKPTKKPPNPKQKKQNKANKFPPRKQKNKTTNKGKKTTNLIYFRLTCNDFLSLVFLLSQ